MIMLIALEAFSIATHLHLFRKKRRAIDKNSEVISAVRDEFATYAASSRDAYQSIIKDMAADIADLKYKLRKLEGKVESEG